MSNRVHRRTDTSPAEGKHNYGDVAFADPVNKKYPIDTKKHVRAGWRYINKKANSAKYDPEDIDRIEGRIKAAARRYRIEIPEA